ncbi:MAG: WD40 repeat domain-containing protein [Isosphaeraceae bacterium]
MPSKNGSRSLRLLLATLALLFGVYILRSLPPGERIKAIPLPKITAWPYDLAWSRDGKTLAVAKEEGLELWDVTIETVQPLISRPPDAGPAATIAYSKSGRLLAVAYPDAITVWKTSEWKKVARVTYDVPMQFMTFTDGDTTLLAALLTHSGDTPRPSGMHTQVIRWDVSSGNRLSTVDFGSEGIFKVLSPSGRHGVIFIGHMGVYDLTTRAEILNKHTTGIYSLGARKSPIIPTIVFRGCSAG